MRRGQASMEMLLLTAGAVLTAVVAGYYAVSSTASVYSELNNVAYSTPTTGGSSVTLTFTVSPASGSPSTTFHLECSVSGGAPSSVGINVDSSPVAVCSSSPCSYDGSFSIGNHTATCTANVGGNTYTKNASFSVVDNPPSVSAVATDVGGGSYELNCSATDDVQLSQISIYLDGGSTPEKTCSFSGVSGTCSKTVSVAAGSHELNCVAVDSAGHLAYDVTSFSVSSTCADECNAGTTDFRCDANILQERVCGNYDADPCVEWSSWSDVNNCATYSGKYGTEYREYYCDSGALSCAYSVVCTDDCAADQNRCNGNVFQKRSCGNFDSDPCTEYGPWQDVNNCDDYDGWNGTEYRDYSCDTSSLTGCSYTVTQTCSNECTEGDTKLILCPKWVCQHLPGLPGCNWKLNWVICGYQHCKTTCDSDPCTEWC